MGRRRGDDGAGELRDAGIVAKQKDDPRVPGAALESQIASTTLESSEIVLFANDALPSPDEICFPTVSWALDHCLAGAPFVQQRTKWYFADTDEWRTIDEELRSAA